MSTLFDKISVFGMTKDFPTYTSLYARRPKRPKSCCRYDPVYRVRSRRSEVEEHLFGESHRQSISRCRSMETITTSNNNKQYFENSGNKDSIRVPFKSDDNLERPQTAMACLRGQSRKRIQIVSRDLIRTLGVDSPTSFAISSLRPLIISRKEFDDILKASNVTAVDLREPEDSPVDCLTQADIDRVSSIQNKKEILTDVNMGSASDSSQNRFIIERAEILKDENIQEVKQINRAIAQVKCRAVRDKQIQDKKTKLLELIEADRVIEAELEANYEEAKRLSESRANQILEINMDYRRELDRQRIEQADNKLLQDHEANLEAEVRRKVAEKALLDDQADLQQRQIRSRQLRKEIEDDISQAQKLRMEADRSEKLHEEKINEIQHQRHIEEIKREEAAQEAKRKRQQSLKLFENVANEKQLRSRKEQLRLTRQTGHNKELWVERECLNDKRRQEISENVRADREEQRRMQKMLYEKQLKLDEADWLKTKKMWKEEADLESQNEQIRIQSRIQNLAAIQKQIDEKEKRKLDLRKTEINMSIQEREAQFKHEERVKNIMERKLKELRELNLPEIYLVEVEKKIKELSSSKFSSSYLPKK